VGLLIGKTSQSSGNATEYPFDTSNSTFLFDSLLLKGIIADSIVIKSILPYRLLTYFTYRWGCAFGCIFFSW